jgi:hypothetical protein
MLSLNPSPELELTVTDAVSADAEHGLRVYGLATKELSAENAKPRAQSWMTVFQKNDVGPGLFAAAKYKGEFVGFITLIDFEMLVGGVPVRAGKAEFWVVNQEAQKIEVPGFGARLPWNGPGASATRPFSPFRPKPRVGCAAQVILVYRHHSYRLRHQKSLGWGELAGD